MASNLIAALLLVVYRHRTKASPIENIASSHKHGFCLSFDLPIPVSVDTAIYDYPKVNSDREAGAWAIYADTWSTPMGPSTILQNTTTSAAFNIHVQLCMPFKTNQHSKTLQIATHGVHYDSRYWDPELDRQDQSYVEAALREGYPILTYDRLGVGQSDKPDAYDVVQAPVELELLRQLTLMARDGSLYDSANANHAGVGHNSAFTHQIKPDKVIHLGHSFGSFLTSAFIAKYSNLTDGAIITGFVLNKYLGAPGMASFGARFANFEPYNRPSGYVVCSQSGIQNIFFAGDLKTAFTQAQLDYGDAIKQPVPIGEFASAYNIIGLKGPELRAPVQYFLAEYDFYICGGDCKNIEEAKPEALATFYPNAEIEVVIQPNTGHAFTLHNNASAGYQMTFDFLSRHGL